jgi:hypothetical protein
MLVLWPLITMTSLPLPGIAIAIFLLLAAELCEAGYLYRQRSRLLEERGLVPLDTDSVHCRNGSS